jgi:hypothetical protein
MQSNRSLKRLYNQYNKKFFGNKLPNITVGFASPGELLKQGLGKKTCAVTLFDKHQPIAIYVKRYKRKEWPYIKSDLLHEMAHVALPFRVNHGPRFQAEMLRLAQAGAFKKIW